MKGDWRKNRQCEAQRLVQSAIVQEDFKKKKEIEDQRRKEKEDSEVGYLWVRIDIYILGQHVCE